MLGSRCVSIGEHCTNQNIHNNYEKIIKPMYCQPQLLNCLTNFCVGNNITVMYQSAGCFLIEESTFEELKDLLLAEYPDVIVRYNVHFQELLDFGFESSESLSHFLLSWS